MTYWRSDHYDSYSATLFDGELGVLILCIIGVSYVQHGRTSNYFLGGGWRGLTSVTIRINHAAK